MSWKYKEDNPICTKCGEKFWTKIKFNSVTNKICGGKEQFVCGNCKTKLQREINKKK